MFNQLIRFNTEEASSNRLEMINKWTPIFHTQKGFHGIFFVNSENINESSVIVIWDSEEAAMRAAESIKTFK